MTKIWDKWESGLTAVWLKWDPPIVFTAMKKSHITKLEDLLKALLKNGLKISPMKCQLFWTELQYMGNTIFTQDRRVCVKPLRRLEAIQKLQPPTTVKGGRSFAWMINFLSRFRPELQKIIKAYFWFNKKRKTIHMGRRATGGIWRHKVQINKTASVTFA